MLKQLTSAATRCSATKANGTQCENFSVVNGHACPIHGGHQQITARKHGKSSRYAKYIQTLGPKFESMFAEVSTEEIAYNNFIEELTLIRVFLAEQLEIIATLKKGEHIAEWLLAKEKAGQLITQIANLSESATRIETRESNCIPKHTVVAFVKSILDAVRRATNNDEIILKKLNDEIAKINVPLMG